MRFRSVVILLLVIAVMVVSWGCVEYHPYDTNIDGKCDVNASNIALIEQSMAGREQIRFAVVSDSQRWYDELEDAVEDICERDDIDFVIHAGDVTDWALRSEFEMQRDILNSLDLPYVCLLGNHDCLGSGKDLFGEIFGEFDFAFTAGRVRFVCLNTNTLEFDEGEVPNFDFIRRELSSLDPGIERTVVVMHAYPLCDQFGDEDAVAEFQQLINSFPNMQFCIHGHGHRYREEDISGDGVIYYECANVGSEEYLLFTSNKDGYECERCFF